MSFGNPRGYGRTPVWAGALGGVLQGLLGYQKARQDHQQQSQQDARQQQQDALHQVLLQHQMQQGDQQFQANQAAAADERQRRSAQDTQEARAPTLALLSHLLSLNPEHPGPVADAYQSYQSTGQFPASVPLHAAIPLMLPIPGAPGNVPATVNVPGSLGNVYAAAGLPQGERDFQARQKQASDLAGDQLAFKRENQAYLQQRDALREQAKAATARFKDRGQFYQRTHDVFTKGGMKLEDLGPALQEAMDNWDAVNGGGAPAAAPGVGAALAPAPSGPTGALPGVQAGIDQKKAQAARATAQASNIPIAEARKQAESDTRQQIAVARQQSYQGMLAAREKADAVREQYQNRTLTLKEAQQAHKESVDATGTWFQKERVRLDGLKRTLSGSAASPQAAALRSQLAGLEKTRAQLQSAYNKYDQGQVGAVTGAGGNPPNPQSARVLGQKAKDLHDQITAVDTQIADAIGQLRSAPAPSTNGLPVLPPVGGNSTGEPPPGSTGSRYTPQGPPSSLAGPGASFHPATGSERQRFIRRAMLNGASRQQAEQKANQFELR